MSNDSDTAATVTVTATAAADTNDPPPSNSLSISQLAIQSLSTILPSIPPSLLSSSTDPSLSLLRDPDVSAAVSLLLRRPTSGAGDDSLCRWLYDAFQSGDPGLRLVVLRHTPLLAGAYLSRAALRQPLAGFEAVLLALYAHETVSRAGQPVTINVPDMSHPSLYHETTTTTTPARTNSTALNLSVVSPTLEPHGTVRSTRRARIVGVALELYYGKIHQMPKASKLDFCQVCKSWAGDSDDQNGRSDPSLAGHVDGDDEGEIGRSIPLPWELLQPIMRILGHCIVGYWANDKDVREAAKEACRSLHVRAVRDINAKAILATESLLRIGNMSLESPKEEDHQVADANEVSISNVINA